MSRFRTVKYGTDAIGEAAEVALREPA